MMKTTHQPEDDFTLLPGISGNISAPVRAMREPDEEDEDREDDDAPHKTDWGDVDPQHDPMAPPSPMDPSAPGSAV